MSYRKKYAVKQISDGRWAVWKNAKRYFSSYVYDVREEAIVASLYLEGHEYVVKLDNIQEELVKLGVIDYSDPYGWRA